MLLKRQRALKQRKPLDVVRKVIYFCYNPNRFIPISNLLFFCTYLKSCSCFTTEILEGFDLQRTSGLGDTLKKYGYLTQAIAQCYKSQIPEERHKSSRRVCPRFNEFVRKCEELDKMTINDLFAIQLMQVLIFRTCRFSFFELVLQKNTFFYLMKAKVLYFDLIMPQ